LIYIFQLNIESENGVLELILPDINTGFA
jgi:hypothetical protein